MKALRKGGNCGVPRNGDDSEELSLSFATFALNGDRVFSRLRRWLNHNKDISLEDRGNTYFFHSYFIIRCR